MPRPRTLKPKYCLDKPSQLRGPS